MLARIKKLWINALRSGEYKQEHGCLMSEHSSGERAHCCLAVLTDLYINETGGGEWVLFEKGESVNEILGGKFVSVLEDENWCPPEDINGEENYLAHEVLCWAGLGNAGLGNEADPTIYRKFIEDKKLREKGETSTLSGLNDAKNDGVYVYDFNRIANVIDMAIGTEDIADEHCRKRSVWEYLKTKNYDLEDFNYEKY
jgi:hypothetical protein